MMLFLIVLLAAIANMTGHSAACGFRSGAANRVRQSAWALILWVCASIAFPAGASTSIADFDAANKLYDQGKYREAAGVYQKLIESGTRSETVYFNLGDARFKAGQIGLAIAAWREAERLRPRDPSVRFNLQFARQHVSGKEGPAGPLLERALRALTLNEWAVLVSVAWWVWFLLLALRELQPPLRKSLSGYTATAGVVVLLLAVCLAAAAGTRLGTTSAIVIVPDAIARQSPWEEAQVQHQFRDGTELTVLDEIRRQDADQNWLQVRDGQGQTGWVKSEQLVVIRG